MIIFKKVTHSARPVKQFIGGTHMKQEEIRITDSKAVYASPNITEIRISADILTESPVDDNMGEWDTEM